jgi:pyruvate dehydrogenase E2 component (dihydrolipoamide acetyltransferase)
MAETINMPKLGFDMAEGTLVRWLKKVDEVINKGDVLAEIETDKATVEVESPASGVVRLLLVEAGAVVPVNTPIAVIGTRDEPLDALPQAAPAQQKKEATISPVGQPVTTTQAENPSLQAVGSMKASPLARKMALENSLDLSQITGSGPGGRIVRRDIEAVLVLGVASQPAPKVVSGARLEPPGAGDVLVEPSKLRKAIARRMGEAKASIPHFYVSHEFKVDSLLEMRRQLNKILPETGKVSVNDFIVKAVALALQEFPNLNASWQAEKTVRHAAINIGIAVAVEGGLLTVVCKQAAGKHLSQIALEVKGMAERARLGKVRPEDIEGSTFSISNLGMFDVENFIAIINPPEAAILAVGSAREVPVVENGILKTGWRLKASLSVDHRVSDGAEAARFLQALAVYLEEPVRLLI